MDNLTQQIRNRLRLSKILIGVSLVVALCGIALTIYLPDLRFYVSFMTHAGFVFTGLGVGLTLRYRAALRGEVQARRLASAEFDERNRLLQGQAGYRAWWTAFALTALFLFWLVVGSQGWTPELSRNAVIYLAAICLFAPLFVYLGSYTWDSRQL
jgi:hypothetical protein